MRSCPPASSARATMFTRSLDRRPQTAASAPGLFGRRRFSSVRIMRGEITKTGADRPQQDTMTAAARPSQPMRAARTHPSCPAWPTRRRPWRGGVTNAGGGSNALLRQNLDHDAAVLRPARLRLVRRDRLVLAVADHIDLVQRHLVLLVQISLHRFGAGQSDPLVRHLVTNIVGVTLDLKVDVLRILLQLRHHLVDALFGCIREIGLAELEVALILAQDDLEHRALVRPVDRVDLGVGLFGGIARSRRRRIGRRRRVVRLLGGLRRSLRLLIDFRNPAFVPTRALLGLFQRAAHRIDFVVYLTNAGSDKLLGGTGGRSADGEDHKGNGDEEFPQHVRSPPTPTSGLDCPAIYPLRARTVRSLFRARTTSECQPGWPLDSNAIRY